MAVRLDAVDGDVADVDGQSAAAGAQRAGRGPLFGAVGHDAGEARGGAQHGGARDAGSFVPDVHAVVPVFADASH